MNLFPSLDAQDRRMLPRHQSSMRRSWALDWDWQSWLAF